MLAAWQSPRMNRANVREETVEFVSRLALVYGQAKQIEELRYPGLARSAHTLITKEPAKYARIATALLDGISPSKIAAEVKVSANLVRFIRQMHPELVAASRTQLVTNLEEVVGVMTRRLLEEADSLPIDKIPAALATVLGKLSVLTGGVSARVEHTSVPRPEELERMFKALPAVKDV